MRLWVTTTDLQTQENLARDGWTGVGEYRGEMSFFWQVEVQGWPPDARRDRRERTIMRCPECGGWSDPPVNQCAACAVPMKVEVVRGIR